MFINFLDSDHSVVLKEISVPLWENLRCQEALKKHFGPTYHLPFTAICAGSEGKDACDVSKKRLPISGLYKVELLSLLPLFNKVR